MPKVNAVGAACAAISILSTANVVSAAPNDDPFPGTPRAAYCDGYDAKTGKSGRINGPKLLNALLSTQQVSQEVLDRNGDGTTTFDEKLAAVLLDNRCEGVPCRQGDDGKLKVIKQQLSYFTSRHERYPEFRVRKLQSMDERDRFNTTKGGGLNQPRTLTSIHPVELLDPSGIYVDAVCLAAAKPIAPPTPSPGGSGATPQPAPSPSPLKPEAAAEKPTIPGSWRVAGQADHLGDVARPGGKLDNVAPAELSLSGDRVKDKTDGLAKAYAGYSFAWYSDNLADRYSVIPYAFFERTFKRQTGKKTERTHLMGVGAFGEVLWAGSTDAFADYISFATRYDTDLENDTSVISGVVNWTPAFLYASPLPVDRYARIGGTDLQWRISPRLQFVAGHVFDDGGLPDLENKSQFVRAGGELVLGLKGNEKSPLSQFELTARLVYQQGIAGKLDHYFFGSVALAYVFPEQNNWVLKLEYTKGRHEKTLDKQETWRTSVGFRF
jgi:hypothetical protein